MDNKSNKLPQIIHIDMDAFFAAVEVRDNPELRGLPLIIGSLPNERGVVSTCSYEARKFGVRSAMSIKEAYRRCPNGIYMHPNMEKYVQASAHIHKIWAKYTDLVEYISLDEGFLDVTGSAKFFGGAVAIGHEIRERTYADIGLTCSVGVGYSMMSAKLASEEKKPNGFFEIRTPQALQSLILDRNVRVIYGVGLKTAAELEKIGVSTVSDLLAASELVIALLGNTGRKIISLANGIDNRKVTPDVEAKSFGTETTFQNDITDFEYLKDYLLLTSEKLSYDIAQKDLYAGTITVKITFSDMKSITRSKTIDWTRSFKTIYHVALSLLEKVEKRPIRLLGITLSNFSDEPASQISLFDNNSLEKTNKLDSAVLELKKRFGRDIIKSGSSFAAKKRLDKIE